LGELFDAAALAHRSGNLDQSAGLLDLLSSLAGLAAGQ